MSLYRQTWSRYNGKDLNAIFETPLEAPRAGYHTREAVTVAPWTHRGQRLPPELVHMIDKEVKKKFLREGGVKSRRPEYVLPDGHTVLSDWGKADDFYANRKHISDKGANIRNKRRKMKTKK